MDRKPELDWWDNEVPAPEKPSIPNTKAELDQLERDLARAIEMEKTPLRQQLCQPLRGDTPDLHRDLEHCTAVTFTIQGRTLRQMQNLMKLMQLSEQVIMNMDGGDMILVKDRLRHTPALLQAGSEPWESRAAKKKRRR